LIPLLFQFRFIIGYQKIIAQLIIVIDLQINQSKVSINLLAFSLLTKVQSQLKMRTFRLSTVNSTKVQSQSNLLCLIMFILLSPHQIKSLINQSKVSINCS